MHSRRQLVSAAWALAPGSHPGLRFFFEAAGPDDREAVWGGSAGVGRGYSGGGRVAGGGGVNLVCAAGLRRWFARLMGKPGLA
jgi:hypothetical protein